MTMLIRTENKSRGLIKVITIEVELELTVIDLPYLPYLQ